MLFCFAISAWLLLIRLGVGAPALPERRPVRSVARRRAPRLPARR